MAKYDENYKACCFAGHRYEWHNLDIETALKETIEKLILSGYGVFYDGNYGYFDFLCRKTVLELKNKYPHIKLILVLTYYHHDNDIPSYYDSSVFPDLENVFYKKKITERNKWIVNHSDTVIAHINNTNSGAYKTVKYAQKLNKSVILI